MLSLLKEINCDVCRLIKGLFGMTANEKGLAFVVVFGKRLARTVAKFIVKVDVKN
jgi:hypothetical protein